VVIHVSDDWSTLAKDHHASFTLMNDLRLYVVVVIIIVVVE
jgi:hypothetical protein